MPRRQGSLAQFRTPPGFQPRNPCRSAAADPGARLMVTLRQRRRPGGAAAVSCARCAGSRTGKEPTLYVAGGLRAAAWRRLPDFDAVRAFATVHGVPLAESKRCSSNSLLPSHRHSRSRLLFRGSALSWRHASTRRVNKIIARQADSAPCLHRGSCGMLLDLLR
jgi:hypothetical protein